jgi:hypothetical protein
MALLILIKRVGAADEAVGETAGPFRGPRATGGSMCGEARHRCRRRFPEIRPDGASPIATAKWFRRSCHVENGGKRQRSESAPAETSSPALVPRATPIPSVRAPRRTRRNGSSTGPRASLLGSNRVTSSNRTARWRRDPISAAPENGGLLNVMRSAAAAADPDRQ